jgi:hypothetical protein
LYGDSDMRCDFENADVPDATGRRKVRCKRCGFTGSAPGSSSLEKCYRICDKFGLGDYVHFGLATFGITPDRVKWVRGWVGLSGCGNSPCEEKQEALNEAGKKIGL